MQKIPKIYRDSPVFAVDIGHNNIKVVEVVHKKSKHYVRAYGVKDLDPKLIDKGVILDSEKVATHLRKLIKFDVSGKISAKRAVLGVPARFAYSRAVFLPKMKQEDIKEAVMLEVEQNIPVPASELYISYEVVEEIAVSSEPKTSAKEIMESAKHEMKKEDQKGENETKNTEKPELTEKQTDEKEPEKEVVKEEVEAEPQIEVVINATPKNLIDAYLETCEKAGIEVCAIESSLQSLNRLIGQADDKSTTTLLIDVGDTTVDMCVVDNVVRVTGAVKGGGQAFTTAISKQIKISHEAAVALKFKYGLNVSQYQDDIKTALEPQIKQLAGEIQRIMRFYEDRAGKEKAVKQIITTGGGAAMPGFSEYLINSLRIPVRMVNVWQNMDFSGVEKPSIFRNSTYATAVGLALVTPKEVYG